MNTEQGDVYGLVTAIVNIEPGGAAAVAKRLGVTTSTVTRWMDGTSRPRAAHEGRIRSIAVKRHLVAEGAQSELQFSDPVPTSDLRPAFEHSLREMREVLHRRGSLSSRHEALDELAKLLFAHFLSLGQGQGGLCSVRPLMGKGTATALHVFVENQFRLHLPTSISHELDAQHFRLRLRASEDDLAAELISCFSTPELTSNGFTHWAEDRPDLLNDAFGHFLADSFVDEKELGQYLTPHEVVDLMVAIGLDSLGPDRVAALCDPTRVASAGVILDPSCGVGSFLSMVLRTLAPQVRADHGSDAVAPWVAEMMASALVGIDKSERMIRLALTNLALFGVPSANLHLANALSHHGSDGEITLGLGGKAQLILTNPPFGAEFDRQELRHSEFAKHVGSGERIDSELLFMERYLEWLAPGGVLVTIIPDSILTNKGAYEALRDWLGDRIELLSVVSLPKVTFGAAGTDTKTSILHVRKTANASPSTAYFAVCNDIGYEVVTRDSQRRKVRTGDGELRRIQSEIISGGPPESGRRVRFDNRSHRWDATFYCGVPEWIEQTIARHGPSAVRLRDLASLVSDRRDPRRFSDDSFNYIEISNIARDRSVSSKSVASCAAPSRARKTVKAGDILVSTVRPDRRTIGVVPSWLDNAICSTGIAVLRCHDGFDPQVVAAILQSDVANAQILRHNVGIAYPAIDEECLPDIVLPASINEIAGLSQHGKNLRRVSDQLQSVQNALDTGVERAITNWQRK